MEIIYQGRVEVVVLWCWTRWLDSQCCW